MASHTSFLPEMDDHPPGSRSAFRRSTSSLKRFTNFRLGSTPDTLDIPSLTASLRDRSKSPNSNTNSQASISTPAASQLGSPRLGYLDKHPPSQGRSNSRMSDSRLTTVSAGSRSSAASAPAHPKGRAYDSSELRSDGPPVHKRYMRERGAASAPSSPGQSERTSYHPWGSRLPTTLAPPAGSYRSAGSGSQGRSSFSPLPLHRSEHSDSSASTIPATPVLAALPDPGKITAPFPNSVEAMDALVDSLNGGVSGASGLGESFSPNSRRRADRERARYERYLYAPPLPKPPEGVTLGRRQRAISEDSIGPPQERELVSEGTRARGEREKGHKERDRERERARKERKDRERRERIRERDRLVEKDKERERERRREKRKFEEALALQLQAHEGRPQQQEARSPSRLRSREPVRAEHDREREREREADAVLSTTRSSSRLRRTHSRDASYSHPPSASHHSHSRTHSNSNSQSNLHSHRDATPGLTRSHSRSQSRLRPAASDEWDRHLETRELTEPVRRRRRREAAAASNSAPAAPVASAPNGVPPPSAAGGVNGVVPTRANGILPPQERAAKPEPETKRDQEREEDRTRRKDSKNPRRTVSAQSPEPLSPRQRRDAQFQRDVSDLRCLSDDPASPVTPANALPILPGLKEEGKSAVPFPSPAMPSIRTVPSTPRKPREEQQGLPRSRPVAELNSLTVPEPEVTNLSFEHIGALVRRGDSPGGDLPPSQAPKVPAPPLPPKSDARKLAPPAPAPIRTSGSSLEPLPSPSISSPPTSPGYDSGFGGNSSTGPGASRKSLPPTISEIIRTHGPALNKQSSFASPRGSTTAQSVVASGAGRMLSPQKEVPEEAELSHRSSLDSIAEEVRRTLQLAEDGSARDREAKPYVNKGKSASEPPASAIQSRVQITGEPSMPQTDSYSPSVDSNFPAGTSFLPIPAAPAKGASSENLAIAQQLRSPRYTKLLTLKRSPHRGLTVSLADVGSSTGHPVFVFLGLGCVRYIIGLYDEMAEALGLRLVCVDRWGLGKTDDVPAEKRGLLEWAAVMEEVADMMDITEFSMLAHSAGAPYSLATALRLGRRVAGSIHLLAPWVSTTVEGGYKWLKYVPNGLLKTAQAAEWKVQGWRLGKPPTIQYQAIGYNAATGASTGVDDRQSFQFSDYDDLADFDGRFSSRTSLQATINGISSLPPIPPTPPTSSDVSPKGVVKHKTSKGIMSIFRGNKHNGGISPKTPSSTTSTLPKGSRGSFITGRRHSNAGQSIMSATSTLPSLNLPTIEPDDVGLGIKFDILEEYAMTGALPTRKSDGPPTINPRAGLGRRSISLTSRNSSRNGGPSALAAPLMQRANTSPTAPPPKAPGKAITLADALVRASHAESLKGGTADLLAILERDSKPWGFSYTDVRHSVLVWYGEKDEKISINSVRWMERAMTDCKVKLVQGAGHSLLTNAQVVVEALESIAKECVIRDY